MPAGIKLDLNNSEIERRIIQQLAEEMNNRLSSIRPKLEQWLRSRVLEVLCDSPEVKSLRGIGDRTLMDSFGIENPEIVLDLMRKYADSFTVELTSLRPTTRGILATPCVKLSSIDIDTLASDSNAVQLSRKGIAVEWFLWCAEYGSKVITGYWELQGNSWERANISRAHNTIMKANVARQWSFPTQFGRNESDDNFLIRALTPLNDEIEQYLTTSI